MKSLLILSLSVLLLLLTLEPIPAQNVIFEANFNNTFQSTTGEDPTTVSGVEFVSGLQGEGILIDKGDVLQYALTDNIRSQKGSMTLWVKPDWNPGDTLRRIMLIDNSPVFELHVDEGSNLVLAMFSAQIETRVGAGYVGNWKKGEWHFLGFNWSSDQIEIFVDGNNISQTPVGFDIPAFGGGMFNLGASGEDLSFNGTLDELTIYDAPLSNMEMARKYESDLNQLPNASAISLKDIFGREVSQTGLTLVDWEGPIRNPAMKYFIKGDNALSYPVSISLSTAEENTSFNLPSTISSTGPTKTVTLDAQDDLESFLFSFYMDEDFEEDDFDLVLTYNINGLPSRQIIPVKVIDQDRDRPLSYPVIVDFSEAVHPLMVNPETQKVIVQAAEDWLYYVDGEGFDEIQVGESALVAGGQDHFFEEKVLRNSVPYKGYYLFAYGNSNPGPCVCSTGAPNRELLQTRNQEEVPIFRIGGLHLNIFGQAFATEPTGWEVLSPYENWTQEGYVGADIYTLAKHEIGHAMVFENSPLFLKAQGRDPNNPFPDESVTPIPNGFTSPALTAYYPDEVVPLFANSLSHVIDVLDPASQMPPYGGGVPEEIMPLGREMMTKLDILIMESVGYPLRENEVTKALSITSEDSFRGDLGINFEARLIAEGGIPVYDYTLASGSLPRGLALDRRTGEITGTPEEEGEFPITFQGKDYDERSLGATFDSNIKIGIPLSNAAELIRFAFDSTLAIVEVMIDSSTQMIRFQAAPETDITELLPLIEISEFATISPAADIPQDFTNPVSYTITSEDGNVTNTWMITIDLIVVSIDNEANQKLSIYPNPANKELIVEFSKNNAIPTRLQFFNLQGQLIKSTPSFFEKTRVPIQDIPSGWYLLRVLAPNGVISTHKIVIDHQ